MRSTKQLIAIATLALAACACGADNPPGTISEDALPSSVKVQKVTHDDQAGQVTCPQVNDAEDNHVMTPSDNYPKDKRAAVSYELKGSHRETVSDSVWRLSSPQDAVAAVRAGIEACAKADPQAYKPFEVQGHPGAVGYLAMEGAPTPTYTRRILVPLADRVVIVTSTREGDADFAVPPEELLTKAIEASKDAPKA